MANLIREFDWRASPLGPIETWPGELISAVNLVLAWPSPMTLYWGPKFCLIYNDDYRHFLHGKHPASLGAAASVVWQEMWEAVEPDFLEVFQNGRSVVQRDVYLPSHRDGAMHDDWWTYTLSPLFQGGRIAGILNAAENRTEAFVTDRTLRAAETDRAVATAKLATSEQRLQIALQTAKLGVWQLNLQTMRLEGSPTFKAAYGRAAEDPFTFHDLRSSVHPDDLPELQAMVDRADLDGNAYSREYRVIWPDGTMHWVLTSGQKFLATETTPPMRAGVVLDVTERHQTMAALIQSEKLAAVGRLASSIAHEINNPLEAVTNLIYLAKSHAILPSVQEYLTTAERELQRMGVIANQTLRFHKQSTNASSCSCVELISSALTIYEGKLVNSGIAVHKRKRANRPVMCFEGEIRQVLSNLIGNAIDAMHGSGGSLYLRSREGTDWGTGRRGIVLTVADTGAGMSPLTQAHLFEAFYTTKGLNGTGLGLWISAGIVRNHEGRLTVRSRGGPGGHGTVFILFLPFKTEHRTVSASLPSSVASA